MAKAMVLLFKGAKTIISVLCIVLIALLIMQMLYASPLLAEGSITHTDNSIYGLYTIHRYGNVTLLLLNTSALRYMDGFWIATLGDVDRIDIAEKILNIVGDNVVQCADIVIENGEPRTLRGNLSRDISKIVTMLVNEGLKNGKLRISTLSSGSLWLRIDRRSVNELGVERLVKAITGAVPGKRVIVQEVVSLGRAPSYFDAQDMYESFIAIPCFTSLAETPYGLVIVFNQRCAQRIANQTNASLDQVVEDIVGKLRDATPLLRRYIPCKEFLVIFTNVYPSIPLVAEPRDIAKVKTEPGNETNGETYTAVISEQNRLKPWIINDYGSLVVIRVNRSMFKNLGNGFWLIVLPDMKYSEFDDIALNQVEPYLDTGGAGAEVILHVIWSGETYVVKVNETRSSSRDLEEIHKRIKEFLNDLSCRGLTSAEMKLFIKDNITHILVGGIGELGIDEFAKLAHQYFKDFSKRIIVVEKFGWLPPGSPYQRIEMLETLGKVPCFFSFGEAVYGTSIIFNATCIKELAEKNNTAFNEAVEHIVGEVKELNPLIRRYLPWQEILILVAKTPKLIMPVGTTSTNTSKPSSEVQVETAQTEKQPQNATATTTQHKEGYTIPHQLMLITLLMIVTVSIITAVVIRYKS